MNTYSLTLVHLFPKQMNMYGDMGNIITLRKRCEWRGIEIAYRQVDAVSDFDDIGLGDIYFFGGGQDADQTNVWNIISRQQELFTQRILHEVNDNKVFLLICGGYQLFGRYFIDGTGKRIPGMGILDIETKAPDGEVATRCIGNVVIETDLPLTPHTLVGFENHGGQTTFVPGSAQQLLPLGRVVKGWGNNAIDKLEGCRYKHIFGSYLHGSLLPKNPHFADYLISLALAQKYQQTITLSPLDDRLEMQAHTKALAL